MEREEEIRGMAYYIWENEGCIHGHDIDHWLKAEAIWEEQQKNAAPSTDPNIGKWLQAQRMDMPR